MFSLNYKNVHHVEIYLPCNFEVNLITHLGVIALFSSFIFFILILFVLYFKNYKRKMFSLNYKIVQHVKIYLPCNFEVNPSTHFGLIALFSSPGPKVHVNYCHHVASVVCCLSSVNFSHFKLLLRNHLADWNQT